VDGKILRDKSLKIAATVGIEKISASNRWISCFKQRHGLVFKKFARESASVDINATDVWFERLLKPLEEARVIYNADETSSFSIACQTKHWHWKERPAMEENVRRSD
jgi:hypothetical protein